MGGLLNKFIQYAIGNITLFIDYLFCKFDILPLDECMGIGVGNHVLNRFHIPDALGLVNTFLEICGHLYSAIVSLTKHVISSRPEDI